MKIIVQTLVILLVTVIVMTSCQKENNNNPSVNKLESDIVSRLISEKDHDVISLSFGTQLDYNQRYEFVIKRLAIIESTAKLSDEQKIVIREVIGLLKPEFYIPNSNANKIFLNSTFSPYKSKIASLFTLDEMKSIFASFDHPAEVQKLVVSSFAEIKCGENEYYTECMQGTLPCKAGCECKPGYVRNTEGKCVDIKTIGECNCTQSDNWCGSGISCLTRSCKSPIIGCGWLTLSTCDGLCNN